MEVMKYLKLFQNFKDIGSLCKEYGICNYKIGSDGLVDVDGNVDLEDKQLDNLPIKFGKVSGYFNCSTNKLTSLEGCPKEVVGYFKCSNNQLTSLEGGPKEVGGWFSCSVNSLTSLEGCPKEVGGDFHCRNNQLLSLKGCPQRVGGWFDCSYNQLTSLEGCPKEVVGDFYCFSNKLTIIDYLPEWIEGNIHFDNNKIRDIKVEDKNYRFYGKCYLLGNPIDDLFQYWKGDLKNFILDLELEDFIRDDGKSVDMLRFEYALNGKEYNKEDITNYKLIWKK